MINIFDIIYMSKICYDENKFICFHEISTECIGSQDSVLDFVCREIVLF